MRSPSFVKATLFLSVLLSSCSNSQPSDEVARSSSSCGLHSEVADLVKEINAARSEPRYCGSLKLEASAPLALNCTLQRSAQEHANTLAKKERLSHRGEGNSRLGTRVTSSGYQWSAVGENIAKGQTTASSLLEDWLASRKHCKNLLNAKYQEIGVARKGPYWVAVFATPK